MCGGARAAHSVGQAGAMAAASPNSGSDTDEYLADIEEAHACLPSIDDATWELAPAPEPCTEDITAEQLDSWLDSEAGTGGAPSHHASAAADSTLAAAAVAPILEGKREARQVKPLPPGIDAKKRSRILRNRESAERTRNRRLDQLAALQRENAQLRVQMLQASSGASDEKTRAENERLKTELTSSRKWALELKRALAKSLDTKDTDGLRSLLQRTCAATSW